MPTNTLITPSVVKVAEDVADQIYNFNPSDAPLMSMIGRRSIDNVYFEWQRDTYRTPDATRAAIEGADATYAAQTEPTLLNNRRAREEVRPRFRGQAPEDEEGDRTQARPGSGLHCFGCDRDGFGRGGGQAARPVWLHHQRPPRGGGFPGLAGPDHEHRLDRWHRRGL